MPLVRANENRQASDPHYSVKSWAYSVQPFTAFVDSVKTLRRQKILGHMIDEQTDELFLFKELLTRITTEWNRIHDERFKMTIRKPKLAKTVGLYFPNL